MELPILYIMLVLTLPLISALFCYFVPIYRVYAMSLLFLFIGLVLAAMMPIFPAAILRWHWLSSIELGIHIDRLSGLLITLVYFISLLVHMFSMHYMKDDPGVSRYYFKLGFFTASMIGLLAADHLILVFIFWELVGFSSYLLIGFWFKEKEKASKARAAFMINRVADAGLLIGIILLITVFDISFLSELKHIGDGGLVTFIGVALAIGAFGKSAQFPFFGWLNKAMVGPTPVSALIHAATMVTAGVYLLVRIVPILTDEVMMLVAVVGSLTAFVAGVSAIFQNDIKAVLAYSTISQLGYMVLGVGVGAFQLSVFHLWTHAFFKAGLFLAAGNVIHFMHKANHEVDAQDMRNMGGLKKHLPATFWTFIICGAALAGLPLTSGFLSKEGILSAMMIWFNELQGSNALIASFVGILTLGAAALTPIYVARQVLLVFFDKPRTVFKEKIQGAIEPGMTVIFPFLLLCAGALWITSSFNPVDPYGWFLSIALFGGGYIEDIPTIISWFVMSASILFIVLGGGYAYLKFKPGSRNIVSYKESEVSSGAISSILYEGWYMDKLYNLFSQSFLLLSNFAFWFDKKILDRAVNRIGVGAVVLGKVMGGFDRYVIDGLVNLVAGFFQKMGNLTTRTQAPGVQTQLAVVLLIMIGLMYWFLF
ncbi:MAG: NADH-quinone oxidoreductase subunit L [Cyclobacteriaceae bacterium]